MHNAILPKNPMEELEQNKKDAEQHLSAKEQQNTVSNEQQGVNQTAPTPLFPSPSHKKLVIGIVAVFVLIVAGIAGAYFFLTTKNDVGPVACTAEAKVCPDGSFVGRTGPNCEFEECPIVAAGDLVEIDSPGGRACANASWRVDDHGHAEGQRGQSTDHDPSRSGTQP